MPLLTGSTQNIAPQIISPSNIVRSVTGYDPSGTNIGAAPNDLIGFYGVNPVAQSFGSYGALNRGVATGLIATNASSQSPTAVTANTTVESAFTLSGTTATVQVATTDIAIVNKPTAQAGLGVGNIRISAANTVNVNFSNFTGSTITPTATQTYGVVFIRGIPLLTATLSPASVPANTIAEQQFTVNGIRPGDLIQVSKPTAQVGLDIIGVRAVGLNTVGITFGNPTAAAILPTAAETYTFISLGGLDAVGNYFLAEVNVGALTVVNTVTAPEQAITVTGLLASDVALGVSKPTAQAGLGIAGQRVSAANTLSVTFVNPTVGNITPTASEVYGVNIFRNTNAAPLVIYNPTLTPVSVAANTTAEQTFTVTGLVAGSMVWINKPSATPGLGIVGMRVSAANTLAITYANSTGTAITPPAETYVVGNFQMLISSVGTTMVQEAVLAEQQLAVFTAALRNALVANGLIASA